MLGGANVGTLLQHRRWQSRREFGDQADLLNRTVREQRVGHGRTDDEHEGVAILRHERRVARDVPARDLDAGLRLAERQRISDAGVEALACELVGGALAVERICASCSTSRSAANVAYACATSETRLMCRLRRVCSVARNVSSAWALRLRTRPNTSSS